MEVKDVFYNLTKTLQYIIDELLESSEREHLFQVIYSFINCEYRVLYQSHTQENKAKLLTGDQELIDQITKANMIDSEDYKGFRRQSYSKLYAFIELLNKASNLSKLPSLESLQQLFLDLLTSNDTKLQKHALDCLIKTNYKGGVLKQYSKLLGGLTDDESFKDMIQVINFGSKGNKTSEILPSGEDKEAEEVPAKGKKSEKAGQIARLDEAHRPEVLPIVIKLLLSKLNKKKGAINKKTIYTRRNIVFGFMGQLKPETELQFLMQQILQPVGLSGLEIQNEKALD